MTKPDRRLIKLVNNTPRYRCGGPLLPTAGTIPLASYMLLVDAYEVVKLLRREQAYQRKRARTIVEQQIRWALEKSGYLTTQPDGTWISRAKLLAAMKGKP